MTSINNSSLHCAKRQTVKASEAVSIIKRTQNQVPWVVVVVGGFSPMTKTRAQTAIVADREATHLGQEGRHEALGAEATSASCKQGVMSTFHLPQRHP